MKKIIYGFLLFTVGIMTVSCGSDSSDKVILQYTTDKTLAIVKINLDQLDKKLPKEEMLKDDSKKLSASEKEKMELFLNADKNGIDIEKPLYIVTEQNDKGFAFSFFGWLSDQAKFETNFSKISGKKITIDKTKNLIYADSELIGGIKDKMIVLARGEGNPMEGMYGRVPANGGALTEKFYTDLWARKPLEDKNTVAQIEKSLEAKADISTWVNLYGVINTVSKGYIETLAVNKLLLNSGIGFNLNFEEGKIKLNTNTFFNEDLKKLVEQYYKGKSVDYSIVKNIDLDTAKSFGIGYVSFDFMKHLVKEAGFEAMVNNVLESQGLTFEEITAALNGNYAFVMYKDVEPAPAAAPAEDTADMAASTEDDIVGYEDPYVQAYDPYAAMPKPNTLVALGINGAKAKKLIDLINKNSPAFSSYGQIYSNNNLLVFSTQESNLSLLKSNKAAANKKLDKKSGVNSYTWASGEDINTLIGSKLGAKEGTVKMTKMESVSKIEDGNATSEVTITLDKDKKNALHYLMGYE